MLLGIHNIVQYNLVYTGSDIIHQSDPFHHILCFQLFLRFAVDDDGTNILVIINKGEITGAVDIDNMYEFASSHCDDFKDLRDDEDIVINRAWILNKLAEAEN